MNIHIDDLRANSAVVSQKQSCNIWVSSSAVVVHELPIPNAPKRKWPALIPWMLEDKLLLPPEESHFVIAGKENDRLLVLVTAKAQMQEWQEIISSCAIVDYVLLPDFLALPWHAGLISIGMRDGQVLVRYGELHGFAAAPEFAWYMLAQLLEKDNAPRALAISCAEQDLPQSLQEKIEIRHKAIDWKQISALSKVNSAANLLTGEFAVQKSPTFSRAGLSTAALLLLTLSLAYLALNLENTTLAKEVEELAEQNRSDFYRLFPGLSIRSGNIRETVESFISGRFRQRESLNQAAMQALIDIDQVVSSCNCGLKALRWTQDGLELTLPLAAGERIERWQFDSYQKQVSAQQEQDVTVLLRVGSD